MKVPLYSYALAKDNLYVLQQYLNQMTIQKVKIKRMCHTGGSILGLLVYEAGAQNKLESKD